MGTEYVITDVHEEDAFFHNRDITIGTVLRNVELDNVEYIEGWKSGEATVVSSRNPELRSGRYACFYAVHLAPLGEQEKASRNNYTLPRDSGDRKDYPLFEGLLKYFPAALAGVAYTSKAGNDKHNPGQPLHHARGKSGDHADCILRHLTDMADIMAAIERNHPDTEGTVAALLDEASHLAWRALALSQELHEKYGNAPLAPGAKLES